MRGAARGGSAAAGLPLAAMPPAGSGATLGGGDAVAGGLATLSAVGEYMTAAAVHRSYWGSPDALAFMISRIAARHLDVLSERIRELLRPAGGGAAADTRR